MHSPQTMERPAHRGTTYPRTEYPRGDVDSAALEADLRAEVRFDAGSRALYATDGSIYRQVPIGVVLPRDADDVDVDAAVAVCRRHDAPILPRGCGTGLKGQTCNTAVVIDMTKYMNRILEIDPRGKRARVQPGVVCDDLSNAVKPYHLTYGAAPATHNHAVFGGMLGNNSCGVHSITAGKAQDNVYEMEVLTYDGLRLRAGPTSDEELARIIDEGGRRGEIYAGLKKLRDTYGEEMRRRYPDIPRNVAGYNLPQLLPEHGFHGARALVGSEATCVTILEATVRVVDSPPVRGLVVLGYPDAYSAADHVPQVMAYGPIGLEGFDRRLVEDERKKWMLTSALALLPPGAGWLLAEFGGQSKEEVEGKARPLIDDLKKRPATGHPVARHVQQPLPSSDGPGGGGGAGSSGLPGRRAGLIRSLKGRAR